MATIVKTPSGTWKAVIRKTGWPTTAKTFRLKRDAEDWARRSEDEMVRGVHIQRSPAERMTVSHALDRYLKEVTNTKRPTTQVSERRRAEVLRSELGAYSLATLTPEVIAQFRDKRLAGDPSKTGIRIPRANNTVRLELALLGHLFTVAIKEWGLGLPYNPVLSIRLLGPAASGDSRPTKRNASSTPLQRTPIRCCTGSRASRSRQACARPKSRHSAAARSTSNGASSALWRRKTPSPARYP